MRSLGWLAVLLIIVHSACDDDEVGSSSTPSSTNSVGGGSASSASSGGATTSSSSAGGGGPGFSLRFFGNGVNDIDRVKIAIDAPPVPADIGAGDFTIELWLKAMPGDNGQTGCNAVNDGWIYGNIFLDRDIFGSGENGDFGFSLFTDGVAFGIASQTQGIGVCSTGAIDDGQWHHLAVTRSAASGAIRFYIDGSLEAQDTGPTGDVSYGDGRPTSYPNSDPFMVLGAEKHDAGPSYPSYSGSMDELRLSTVIRYDADFPVPSAPFSPDASTAALYHFDEGSGTQLTDSSGAPGGPSHGAIQVGGTPSGPTWSSDTPF